MTLKKEYLPFDCVMDGVITCSLLLDIANHIDSVKCQKILVDVIIWLLLSFGGEVVLKWWPIHFDLICSPRACSYHRFFIENMPCRHKVVDPKATQFPT